jgi:hypothetical protein
MAQALWSAGLDLGLADEHRGVGLDGGGRGGQLGGGGDDTWHVVRVVGHQHSFRQLAGLVSVAIAYTVVHAGQERGGGLRAPGALRADEQLVLGVP